MPNGSHHPQCFHCAHCDVTVHEESDNEGRCRLHNFTIPLVGEMICRDWQREPDTQSRREWESAGDQKKRMIYDPDELGQFPDGLQALEPESLYRYGYHAPEQPAKFGVFADLSNLIVRAAVEESVGFDHHC